MIEVWKDIKGYENSYQVSNLGRIKSLGNKSNHKKEIILKQANVMKYQCVSLRKNNKAKMFKVHRLVAQAFIPNPENKKQVNHISGIKTDNRVCNLEWCTSSENLKHAFKKGLKKQKKGKENSRSKPIIAIDKNNKKVILEFGSLREAERKLNLPHSNIIQSIKRNGTCGGYKWKMKE